jgi:dynactin 5
MMAQVAEETTPESDPESISINNNSHMNDDGSDDHGLGHTDSDSKDSDDDLYIQTASSTQCFVSRRATLHGAHRVELKGRTIVEAGVVIRGDLASVRIGRYGHLGSGTTVTPAPQWPSENNNNNNKATYTTNSTTDSNTTMFVPVTIGSHTMIGRDCRIEAAAIGSNCWIGDGVRLGKRVIVKDCCVIGGSGSGSDQPVVVSDDTVVPPFTRISISSGTSATSNRTTTSTTTPPLSLSWMELPPSTAMEMQERSMEIYNDFCARQEALLSSRNRP